MTRMTKQIIDFVSVSLIKAPVHSADGGGQLVDVRGQGCNRQGDTAQKMTGDSQDPAQLYIFSRVSQIHTSFLKKLFM